MSEYFRRVVIKSFLKKELINAHLATSLIHWKHFGVFDQSPRSPVPIEKKEYFLRIAEGNCSAYK